MRAVILRVMSGLKSLAATVFLVALVACSVAAQSTSVDYPAPVFSNEIEGRIAARDMGDARLTRHFYTFNGREGDLVMSVETTELNGTVDLFTASGLRPLSTVTLFAASTPTRVTRSVFLRSDERLVLRVEARVSGDAEGVYRIRFEGTFAPASGAQAVPPEFAVPTLSETARSTKGVRRVNAAGATIDEPAPENPVADTTTAATTTATNPDASSNNAANNPAPSTARTTTRTTRPRPPARPGRSSARNAPSRRSSTGASTTPSTGETPAGTGGAESASSGASTTRPTGRTNSRRTGTNRARPTPAERETAASDAGGASEATTTVAVPSAAPVVTATRLVIETKDGERIEREMTGVRRVSVENNQVVIVGRDGKVQRVPMVNVRRMSIEP